MCGWMLRQISKTTANISMSTVLLCNKLGTPGWNLHLHLVLPWLAQAIFNKVNITQDGLLQMLRSKYDPSACGITNLQK